MAGVRYRIKPAGYHEYVVQVKTGWFWWTVKICSWGDDWDRLFKSKDEAKQWIDRDIARREHLTRPVEEYHNGSN